MVVGTDMDEPVSQMVIPTRESISSIKGMAVESTNGTMDEFTTGCSVKTRGTDG